MDAISHMLQNNDNERLHAYNPDYGNCYDVCCLQEVFHTPDRDRFIDCAQAGGLRYHHYFDSGMGFPFGGYPSGLLVLSRFPIIDTDFHMFSVSGHPLDFCQWEFTSGKGVGLARIQTPYGVVDAYLTHLISNYGLDTSKVPDPTDLNLCDRVSQALELYVRHRICRHGIQHVPTQTWT